LQGVGNSITNQINGQFAAAGRVLSPANTTALSYGLEQGEAPIIANQYNQNVAAQQGAAGQLVKAYSMPPPAVQPNRVWVSAAVTTAPTPLAPAEAFAVAFSPPIAAPAVP
jgi:hypothetical protein